MFVLNYIFSHQNLYVLMLFYYLYIYIFVGSIIIINNPFCVKYFLDNNKLLYESFVKCKNQNY